MGKKLIITGADFSVNGFRTDNFVDIALKSDGTNPCKVFFLPTAYTLVPDVNTLPTLPGDAVENSVTADSEIPINGNYASIACGRNQSYSASEFVTIKSISISYGKALSAMNDTFYGINADEVDLRGLHFVNGISTYKMFAQCNIKELKLPEMVIASARYMFYNYANNIVLNELDLASIKKISSDLAYMFMFFKGKSVDVSGIDVSEATVFNGLFKQSTITEVDLSQWNMAAMQWCAEMFKDCVSLTTLHLDNWKIAISSSSQYVDMFSGTTALTTVFVTNCTAEVKTWLLARLNGNSAGSSNNWSETTIDGKAALTHS